MRGRAFDDQEQQKTRVMNTRELLIAAATLLLGASTMAQPGSNDPTFNPGDAGYGLGDGPSGTVRSIIVQSDARIILAGGFWTYNGTISNRIVRLDPDGRIDTSFNIGEGPTNEDFISVIRSAAILPDGRLMVVGGFSGFDAAARNNLALLLPDGSVDTTFDPGSGTDSEVFACAVQPDSKIIIAGGFTEYDGTVCNGIARLNTDGSLDTSFDAGQGVDNGILCVIVQADGKILIGGPFTQVDNVSRNRVARLNTDGSLDPTFDPGSGANNWVTNMTMLSDGKLIVGGSFTTFNGTERNRIARLLPGGGLDPAFDPGAGANNTVITCLPVADNKLLVGGNFTEFNGIPTNRIIMLDEHGTIDPSFTIGEGADAYVQALARQPDDAIIIGGTFTTFNGTPRRNCVRVSASGLLDVGFNPATSANDRILSSAVQENGKILIVGSFTGYSNIRRNRIARLWPDGSLDEGFDPGSGASGTVRTTLTLPSGKILIGGAFNSYDGTPRNSIARINANGSLDATFAPGSGVAGFGGVYVTTMQPDGKILIGGDFYLYNGELRNNIARIHTNGNLDLNFNASIIGLGVRAIALQPDGKILVGGDFFSPNFNLIRLNPDGSLDASFNTGTSTDGAVNAIVVLADGSILVAGVFTSYNGIARNGIMRLNPDGGLDPTFDPQAGANGGIETMMMDAEGGILIGGAFTQYDGVGRNGIARSHADGSLDTGFDPGSGTGGGAFIVVSGIAQQDDGKLVICGNFIEYDGIGRNRIARLNNGSGAGIHEKGGHLLNVYPNPTSGPIAITLDEQILAERITVVDATGRTVLTKGQVLVNGPIPLDLGNLAHGSYCLWILTSDGRKMTGRFIKQ